MKKVLMFVILIITINSSLDAYCSKIGSYYTEEWSDNGKSSPYTNSKLKQMSNKHLNDTYNSYVDSFRFYKPSKSLYQTLYKDNCNQKLYDTWKRIRSELIKRNGKKFNIDSNYWNLENKNDKQAYESLYLMMKTNIKVTEDGGKSRKIYSISLRYLLLLDIEHKEYNSKITKLILKDKALKKQIEKQFLNFIGFFATHISVLYSQETKVNIDEYLELFSVLKKYNVKFKVSDVIDYYMNTTIDEEYFNRGDIKAAKKRLGDLIEKLVFYSNDINYIDKNGVTPLIFAVKTNNYKFAKRLIAAGANIKPTDDNGYTALSYAENNNNQNMIKLIKGGTSGKQTGIDKLLAKKSAQPNYNSFALIIGVNKYMNETNVDYADNSAKSFKLLAQNVLGVPKENIIILTNEKATSGQIKSNIELISQLVEQGSTLYFYYAGHGVPATNGNTYILPSDMKADNIQIEKQLAISKIYDRFASSPAKKVVVFMDSCFSGKDDSGKLLYKGVAPVMRNKKATIDKRKVAVFSAGASTDFANQYEEEEQRMFSYFVMKGLLEGKKNSDELSNYVKMSVKRKSLRLGLSYKQVPQYDGKVSLKIVK